MTGTGWRVQASARQSSQTRLSWRNTVRPWRSWMRSIRLGVIRLPPLTIMAYAVVSLSNVVSAAPSAMASRRGIRSTTPSRSAYSATMSMPMVWARRTVIRLRDFSIPKRMVLGP